MTHEENTTQATAKAESPVEVDEEALGAANVAVRRLISHLRKTRAPREILQTVANESNDLADNRSP